MKWVSNFAIFCLLFSLAVSFSKFGAQATNSKRATTTIDPPSEKKCRVNNFVVQKNFNASLYQGHWFLISWNKHSMAVEHPFLSKFVSIRNAEAYYILGRDDGNFRFLTGGMIFHMFCQQDETVAYVMNRTAPQKLTVQISPKVRYPQWVMQTDYTGYSVIYSCLKVASNGMCEPGNAVVQTMNRKPTGHTPTQQAKVQSVARRLCVDPSELKIVGYDGRCPELDPTNFPQHKILMEGVCFIFFLIVLIIGIIYFTCCRSPAKEKKKEHTK